MPSCTEGHALGDPDHSRTLARSHCQYLSTQTWSAAFAPSFLREADVFALEKPPYSPSAAWPNAFVSSPGSFGDVLGTLDRETADSFSRLSRDRFVEGLTSVLGLEQECVKGSVA
ncbi:MAG: hypothetical protein Q9204_001117 [Flavoplaca sp. TL-2023a]